MIWRMVKGQMGRSIMRSIQDHPDMLEVVEVFYQSFLQRLNTTKITSTDLLDLFAFLLSLLSNEAIALSITCHNNFLPEQMNIFALRNTLLGKVVNIFLLDYLNVYGDPFSRDFGKVLKTLMPLAETGQKIFGDIIAALLKFEDSQAQTFEWINCFFEINKDRAKLEFNRNKVYCDSLLGFVFRSLQYTFKSMCENSEHPVVMDYTYFLENDVFNLYECSLCRATPSDVEKFVFKKGEKTSVNDFEKMIYPVQDDTKFPRKTQQSNTQAETKLFFYILKLTQICVTPMREQIDQLLSIYPRAVQARDGIQAGYAKQLIISSDAQCLNSVAVLSNSYFMAELVKFFTKYLPDVFGVNSKKLSFTPFVLAFLPEFVVSIITDYVGMCLNLEANGMSVGAFPPNLDVVICSYLSSSNLCKNPFLRCELGELFVVSIIQHEEVFKSPHDLLLTDFSKANVVFSLLCFYVDCEKTGSHTQYYDKINWRRLIQNCFIKLWKYTTYQQNIIKIFDSNDQRVFPAFVQHIVSDTNLMLEDSLLKLADIKNVEDKRADKVDWERMSEEGRNDLLRSADENGRQVKNLFSLAESSFQFLKLVIEKTQVPFLDPLVINDVAACFNYFLSCIVGERSGEYKVSNLEQYNFHPKTLLNFFFDIFLYLGRHDNFIAAICEDTRSFKERTFEAALASIEYIQSRSPSELKEFRQLVEKIKGYSSKDIYAIVEEKMGLDIPEEFCDTIMGTLMKDPVELPNSHVIVDRTTIVKHLMNSKEDPYDRTPLELSMVIPLPELKKKIDTFVKEQYAKLK
ncbi:ubiquitination factor E4, putative [Entamoeba invadens IP1]|uniref:ubiquitination factor E4, putative n=1 Tax=Entamoeba invadens IP1 TaxID=370355 RepID=UPI0002C3D374|nr:ubiquitination factor E4, putative [Entamoeba invadens IP1]ELP93805.1 ubiquitination factor E4, putative [Entamoeba invadens IP1]|eukprot:XP_004260576.1 ubiquitination factor E4, putative [Entamoeba invadens IP1]